MSAPLSYLNDEDQDERLDPYSNPAPHLRDQENEAASNQSGDDNSSSSTGNAPKKGGNTPSNTKNIDTANEQEQNPGSWRNEYRGPNGEKLQKFKLKAFLKKRGPMGLIAGLFVGGAAGLSLLLSPAGALIHIKEVLTNKLDSMSSVVEERSSLALGDKMFGNGVTNGTCKVKIKCRFTGLTQRQMDRLEAQGAQLVDGEGKRVTKNALGRYTGGKTLIMPGENGDKVNASKYRSMLKTNKPLRELTQSIYAPRYMSWNDDVSKKIRAAKKLTTNPKSSPDEDEKTNRKLTYEATSGESASADSKKNTQFETNPDGSQKLDSNNNPIPIPEAPDASNLDFGDDAEDINTEADKLKAAAEAGDPIQHLPNDPAGAASLPDYVGSNSVKKGLKAALGFLNPADILVGLCTTYQFINITIVAAKTIALANAMRFSSLNLATADKAKALPTTNPLTTADVARPMNTFEKPNQYGEAFGDSFGYNYAEYGTITDQPLGSSAQGNDTIRLFSSIMSTVNDALGGKGVVMTGCSILTNPFVQGALSLTSFIPGAGQLTSAASKLASKGGMIAAKKAITEKISGMIAKNLSKDALKATAKTASKGLWDMAKGPLALFLGGFIMTKYGIPYIASIVSNTDTTDLDGMTAFDTTANGLDAVNTATALARGLTPMTKDEYSAFNEFNKSSTATYVADQQADSNPLNVNDPYSKANAFTAAFYPLISKLNIFNQGGAGILSAPSAILSSLNPSTILKSTNVLAADTNAELSYCQDSYLQGQNLATSPMCNVKFGFNDVNMLQTVTPSQIVDKMHDTLGQIDDDGNPVPGTDFEKFTSECHTGTENKVISEDAPEDQKLNPDCYGDKNKTDEYKTFHLYTIDGGIGDAMNETQTASAQSAGAAPEECKTMAADDLGQIACKAYQFDGFGYLWGGGHSGTAAGFMTDFQAGKFKPLQQILDCSGLVRMSIFAATGQDIGGMGTSAYPGYGKFKEVAKADAKAGDILYKEGHTEIIVSNDPGAQKVQTFGAHDVYPDHNKDIGPASYAYGSFLKVFRFQK